MKGHQIFGVRLQIAQDQMIGVMEAMHWNTYGPLNILFQAINRTQVW